MYRASYIGIMWMFGIFRPETTIASINLEPKMKPTAVLNILLPNRSSWSVCWLDDAASQTNFWRRIGDTAQKSTQAQPQSTSHMHLIKWFCIYCWQWPRLARMPFVSPHTDTYHSETGKWIFDGFFLRPGRPAAIRPHTAVHKIHSLPNWSICMEFYFTGFHATPFPLQIHCTHEKMNQPWNRIHGRVKWYR